MSFENMLIAFLIFAGLTSYELFGRGGEGEKRLWVLATGILCCSILILKLWLLLMGTGMPDALFGFPVP